MDPSEPSLYDTLGVAKAATFSNTVHASKICLSRDISLISGEVEKSPRFC